MAIPHMTDNLHLNNAAVFELWLFLRLWGHIMWHLVGDNKNGKKQEVDDKWIICSCQGYGIWSTYVFP